MLYYIFTYLDREFDVPGAGVFQFISFRALMSIIIALFITMWLGKYIIAWLKQWQITDPQRDLDLPEQQRKAQTPTMGGLMIIAGTVVPTLLLAKWDNVYVWLLVIATLWMGLWGFVDDYIKVKLRDKGGLRGKFKIMAQVGLGLLIGLTLAFHPDVRVRYFIDEPLQVYQQNSTHENDTYRYYDTKEFSTTIPFVKNNEFRYEWIAKAIGIPVSLTWIVFTIVVIFINTAVSNAANLTDGLDGLAAGVSAIVLSTLAVFAYVSGHILLADYLNIMYIPDIAEVTIFTAAIVGSSIGFLWYNSYPASVFMGDTGSLMLGSVIGTLAVVLRKELLLPLLCGIFLIEALSVIIQVSYFKWTKRRYGQGRRVFLMAPIHHHFQKKGWHENKIVVRFWIISLFLAALTLITLKLR